MDAVKGTVALATTQGPAEPPCRICGVPLTPPRGYTYGACSACTQVALAAAEKRATDRRGRKTGRMIVNLATTRDRVGHVQFGNARSLAEASRVVREYIEEHGLLSSEMEHAFGYVIDPASTSVGGGPGAIVAKVSYNGRVWSPSGERLLCEAAPARKAPRPLAFLSHPKRKTRTTAACTDCGLKGERTGHQTCAFPSEVVHG